MFLNIIHRRVYISKRNVSETGFCFLLQVKPTQLGPIDRDIHVGRTPWTGDQPVARPLPTHRTTRTQNKRTHRQPCLDWDSNP
jgi:hypothetical protein